MCTEENIRCGKDETDMKKTITLKGLCCPNCAAEIEHAVSELDGVTAASIAFMTQRLTVELGECDDKAVKDIMKKITKTVRRIEPDVDIEF